MKYPVFALFALSLFLIAACQGNEAGNSNAAGADPNNLNAQILAEVLASKALLTKFDSTFQETQLFVIKMKQNISGLGDEKRAQVMKIHEGIRVFTDPYEYIGINIGQLETLSEKLGTGTVKVEDAQKEFETLQKQMQTYGEQLTSAKVDFAGLKAEFEQIFTEANQQAAGKQ
ncbi:MAG: hypothetical protein IPH31_15225 [Lewinellaceae bacterium]|nr:hypothetical protein [Lewinellaceae bacterium]